MRRVALTAVAFVLAAGFYLVLIDTVDSPELYVGAGVALLAAAAFEVAREQGLAEVAPPSGWLAAAARGAARVPGQVAMVSCQALAQVLAPEPSRGVFRAVSFEAGGDSARDAGRRALAEALGSLAPRTIVVGIDTERNLLLVHQLHPGGGAEEFDVTRSR